MKITDFKWFCGWMDRALDHHGTKYFNLHGEAYVTTKEEYECLMGTWRVQFNGLCEEKGVTTSCVYNISNWDFLSEATQFFVCR